MKKIVLLLALLFMIPAIVNAETFYAGNQVKEVPLFLDKITKQSYRYFKTAYRRSDDVLVYCVEPNKLLSTTGNYNYITNNQEIALGISKEKWHRIELLAYFGYGYRNHISEKWAAITQYLIWQTVLPEGWFLTFTDGYGGDFKNIHENETNEIESLISNFETRPSFQNETFKITKNNTLVLRDENSVLDNYNLISDSDLNVTIKNNELHIIGVKNGIYKLDFIRGEYIPTKLYLSEGNQAVVSTDGSVENRFTINVIVESGNLKIKRNHDDYLDNESIVENAVYEVVDSEQNKKIMSTNEEGEIILNDLPIGEVVIKELNPSIGYEKDENEYKLCIENEKEVILDINPKLVIKKVNIAKKYLIEKENLLPNEVNSVFSVIKNNELKLTDKTNEKGIVTFMIPYGHYVISQNSSILDYELMDDYNLFVENSEEETFTFINYKKKFQEEIKDEEPSDNKEFEEPEIKFDKEEELPNDEHINNEIIIDSMEDLVNDNLEKEESIIIDNPNTGDNSFRYLGLLVISSVMLIKILRKMQ